MGQIEIRRGPAGSGKSTEIAREIAALVTDAPLGPPILWIVPPAASYHMERQLLTAVDTTVRAEVLHIDRVASRLHTAVGGIRETAVNTTGKRMLLAAVYQESAALLSVLRRVTPTISFLDAVLDVFREMADFGISPIEIETALETAAAAIAHEANQFHVHAGRSLLGKLRDICQLYVGWQRKLEASSLYDPNFLLTKLTPLVQDWHELTGARLFIDGFTSFSPQQLKFIYALAQQAEATVITLPMAADVSFEDTASVLDSLVRAPEAAAVPEAIWTWHNLVAEAKGRGLSLTDRRVPADSLRFQSADDLACVEQLLYSDVTAPASVSPTHVELLTGQSVRAEVDGVAARICEYIEEHQLNYRDVLVLTPDIDTYLPLVKDTFARYGIPYHADDSPSLASHPLARFLLGAMDAVRERCSAPAMMRFLRSPFCDLTLREIDWLESYLTLYEVSGDSWFAASPWRHAEANREDDSRLSHAVTDDARAERLRQQVLHVFADFAQSLFQPTITPSKLARTIWSLLERVKAKHEVAEWIAGEAAAVDMMQASLHEQAWLKVVDLLNDLGDTLPEQPLSVHFLLQLVEEALAGASLVTIPEGLDEVAVLEVERAAGTEAKLTFLLGAVDGALPRRVHQDGILLDDEREMFRALFGTRLGWTVEERQTASRQMPYFALTRASEHLTISYPLANDQGKAVRPALLVSRLQAMFRGTIKQVHLDSEGAVHVSRDGHYHALARMTPAAAWERILPELRQEEPTSTAAAVALSILDTQTGWERETEWLSKTLAGWRHRTVATALPTALTRRLYGTDMQMNVHQLEAYANCPYRYYGSYGLRLREEQKADINAAVRGTLMHDAVEQFVMLQIADEATMAALSDEAAQTQMDAIFDELMQTPKMQVWLRNSTRRQQAEAVRQVLQSAAVVLTRHARHGAFRPKAIELSFGPAPDAQLSGWQVPLGEGLTLHLRGRIDRVDTTRTEDGRHWFRIIDYKSSSIDLDLSKVAHGLQLQLPVYALVLKAQGESVLGSVSQPAGLIYLPLRHRMSATSQPETEAEAFASRLSTMRANGRMIADNDVIVAMDERNAAGTSDLFKRFYTKDGGLSKTAPVLSETDWTWLFEQVEATIIRLARSVHRGEIAIQPARYGQEEACTYCSLAAVCSIDRKFDEPLFRTLPKLSGDKMQVWRQWTEERREIDE